MKKYFIDIAQGIASVLSGMRLTFRHLRNARHMHTPTNVSSPDYFLQDTGIVTLQYPFEKLPVPDNGRYKLYNEIDDCIVCDKCAVICPVNCITIESIKSAEPIGETSDGSVKRLYAPTFDIDMAKCCFCGLCTSVCPTECLTMTNTYDFSTYTVEDLNVSFANMSKEMADEKRKLYEQYTKEKQELKSAKNEPVASGTVQKADTDPAKPASENKVVMKPFIPKPIAKPVVNPVIPESATKSEEGSSNSEVKKPAGLKPVFKPVIAKPATTDTETKNTTSDGETIKKPAGLKPVIKPVIPKAPEVSSATPEVKLPEKSSENEPVKKPMGLKPIIKPVIKKPDVPPLDS